MLGRGSPEPIPRRRWIPGTDERFSLGKSRCYDWSSYHLAPKGDVVMERRDTEKSSEVSVEVYEAPAVSEVGTLDALTGGGTGAAPDPLTMGSIP